MNFEFIAEAATAGIPPESFLRAEGDLELQMVILVAEKAIQARDIHQKNLATQIINNLSKALEKKQG